MLRDVGPGLASMCRKMTLSRMKAALDESVPRIAYDVTSYGSDPMSRVWLQG